MQRLGLGEPLDGTVESIARWDDVQAHRSRTRGWLRRVIDATPDGELREQTQRMWQDTPAEMMVSAGQIIAHILLHERGHHGDISTLLAQLGGAPPGIDYLTYVFFKQRQSR